MGSPARRTAGCSGSPTVRRSAATPCCRRGRGRRLVGRRRARLVQCGDVRGRGWRRSTAPGRTELRHADVWVAEAVTGPPAGITGVPSNGNAAGSLASRLMIGPNFSSSDAAPDEEDEDEDPVPGFGVAAGRTGLVPSGARIGSEREAAVGPVCDGAADEASDGSRGGARAGRRRRGRCRARRTGSGYRCGCVQQHRDAHLAGLLGCRPYLRRVVIRRDDHHRGRAEQRGADSGRNRLGGLARQHGRAVARFVHSRGASPGAGGGTGGSCAADGSARSQRQRRRGEQPDRTESRETPSASCSQPNPSK